MSASLITGVSERHCRCPGFQGLDGMLTVGQEIADTAGHNALAPQQMVNLTGLGNAAKGNARIGAAENPLANWLRGRSVLGGLRASTFVSQAKMRVERR